MEANDLELLEKRFISATQALSKMAQSVADARTVIEYSSERRKKLLAECMATALAAGEPAVKAEALARASAQYAEGLEALCEQEKDAQRVLEAYRVENCKWETCRTLISLHKHLAGNL